MTLTEIGQTPSGLSRALKWGTLPGIWTEDNEVAKEQLLRTYGSTYLREEIQAEALTKNIEGFSRFLYVAAACNGQVLDLTKLASQAGVPRQTAVRFFEILEDTLIVHRCDAYSGSTRQRLLKHPKFYFFDVGVLNGVLGNFGASEDRKGMLFESFVFNQIKASAQALGKNISIATFRTSNQTEVDFIVEWNQEIWAIEVKASSNVAESDLRGIRTFQSSVKHPTRACVIIPEGAPRVIDQIPVLPLYQALNEIGLAP